MSYAAVAKTEIDVYIHIMYGLCMSSKTINLSLPEELLKEVDIMARANYASRSDYVRQVLVEKINARISKEDAWAELLESADEFDRKLQAKGVSDEDIDRLVKETRREMYAERQAVSSRRS